MESRRRRERAPLAVPVLLLAAGWAPALTAVALGAAWGVPFLASNDVSTMQLMLACAWSVVAALLVRRGVRRVALLPAIASATSGVSMIAVKVVYAGIPLAPQLEPLLMVALRLWIPGALLLFSVYSLTLVAGRAPLRRALTSLAVAAAATLLLLAPFREREGAGNPIAGPAEPLIRASEFAHAVVVGAALLAAILLTSIWLRRRVVPDAAGTPRGLGWLVLSQWLIVVFVGPTFLNALPRVAEVAGAVLPIAPAFAVLFQPVAAVVGAIGQGLLAPDGPLRRALVLPLLFLTCVSAYLSVAVLLTTTLPMAPTAIGATAAVVLALSAGPLMRWLQRRLDAAAYGDAADPAQLLARAGSRLGPGLELGALAEALRTTLRLGRLEIHIRDGDRLLAHGGGGTGEGSFRVGAVSADPSLPARLDDPPAADAGVDGGTPGLAAHRSAPVAAAPDAASVLPLRVADGVVGRVVAVPMRGGRLDRRTAEVLERITGVLAIAVRLAENNRELSEARERLDVAAAEARRVVQVELETGIVPALADAVHDLAGATAAVGRDASTARRGFARVRASLAERTGEIRDLARTLLPGALDAGDFEGALRELGPRFARQGVDVRVAPGALDGVAPSRQAALYHFVAETVLLTRRLAETVEVDVEAGEAGRTVVLRGALLGNVDREGAAAELRPLAERVGELGGVLRTGDPVDDAAPIWIEVPR